ncbi:tRNA (adenosine(37)-N6)-threonylcarbamoyltransferase complex transferase subunit TsaD, partial [Candidatus Uhrbacteria bacterium]|nr:tRNA (adenosine(37)-N6)-threonylcarbamoyltransferase complex transferase subunit TsaD [Candidatus Uhrbacteria bacterium]
LVSGGHTELVLMRRHGVFQLVGQTIDDAAGEAFDKVAKMLGLGYPGGPAIDCLAAKGNPNAIKFPRAMLGKESLDFSFSGLKTSVMYYIKARKHRITESQCNDICASVQQAIVDVLVHKTVVAAKKYKVKTVMLGGGVAANRQLRNDLGAALAQELPQVQYSVPELQYTTDNAAMIAVAGFFAKPKPWASLTVDPNLSL